MESKIQIDIDLNGQPQVRIDYASTDDLRDRLIGRFLSRMGIPADKENFFAYCRLGNESSAKNDRPYGSTVFIEPLDEEGLSLRMPELKTLLTEINVLKQVDEMCVQSLNPDHYVQWTEISEALKATRRALKGNKKA